jgi:hypothetical protein
MHQEPLTHSSLRPSFHEIATQKSASPAQMEAKNDAEETTLIPLEFERYERT